MAILSIVREILKLVAAAAITAQASDSKQLEQPLKNWFNDPFFRLTHDIADCPEPLGPLGTEKDALGESHHRLERGQRCYLEKRCRYSSAYDYDKEIAANITQIGGLAVPRSSLWVLVQGRRVWIYGCVPEGYKPGSLRDQLRRVPDVEVAMEQLRIGAKGSVDYRVR
jgi:hypothetical protein